MPGAPRRTREAIDRQLDRAQDRHGDRRHGSGARPAPPPVTNQPRPARTPTEPRANSGLTPEQTIRHIALTHTTHYYRDSESLPSTDDVLKTAAQFAAWIKNGEA
jgi:hypothetical protein